MYQALLGIHNIGRWVVLILLIAAIIKSASAMSGNKNFTGADKKVGLFLMISAHIMLLIGLYQWFAGPWGLQNIQTQGMKAVMQNDVSRFWAVEHITGMIVGIVLITIGRGSARKNISDKAKHTRSFWFYLFALIIIVASVPWPFRDVARPLFPGMD